MAGHPLSFRFVCFPTVSPSCAAGVFRGAQTAASYAPRKAKTCPLICVLASRGGRT